MLKNILKKIALIGITSFFIMSSTYAFVPQVKNFVDSNILSRYSVPKLTEIALVSNIMFHEQTKTLTFDEVENSVGYIIDIVNTTNNRSTTYETSMNSLQVEVPEDSLTGQTIKILIVAKGDSVTTRDSKTASYDYVLQYQTELLYNQLTNDVYTYFNFYLNSQTPISGAAISNFDTMEVEGSNLIVSGHGMSEYGRPFAFQIQFDVSIYPNIISQDFDILTEFRYLMSGITDVDGRHIVVSYKYTDSQVDFTSGLLKSSSPVFTEYLSEGYTITTLQQTNSAVYEVNENMKAFTVNGIYKATSALTNDIVIFKLYQEVQILAQENFTLDSHYFAYFNETGNGTILDGEQKLYNTNLMNHVKTINEIYQS